MDLGLILLLNLRNPNQFLRKDKVSGSSF